MLCLATPVSADSIFGLTQREKLVDIKKRHPEFKFSEKKIDLKRENEKHFIVTGTDLNGTVIFSFLDTRYILHDVIKERLEEYKTADKKRKDSIEKSFLQIREILDRPIDTHLAILRVAWIPEAPTPIEKLYKKFGNAREEYISDSFSTSISWPQGITATLSDDNQSARAILYDLRYKTDD